MLCFLRLIHRTAIYSLSVLFVLLPYFLPLSLRLYWIWIVILDILMKLNCSIDMQR